MKEKLTITIEKNLIPLAKRTAKRRGKSLSSIIEDLLLSLHGEAQSPFSERWRGKFKLAKLESDGRTEFLHNRYKI